MNPKTICASVNVGRLETESLPQRGVGIAHQSSALDLPQTAAEVSVMSTSLDGTGSNTGRTPSGVSHGLTPHYISRSVKSDSTLLRLRQK